MQKSLISTVFGLMLIIIIIETTSLTSTLPQSGNIPKDATQVQASQVVPTAPLPAQEQLQSDPARASSDSALFLSSPDDTAVAGSVEKPPVSTDTQTGQTDAAGNTTTGFWGDISGSPGTAAAQNDSMPPSDQAPSLSGTSPNQMYVQYETPIPDGEDDLNDFTHARITPAPTLPPEDNVVIFKESQLYEYNRSAISYHLINPPMTIFFNITPELSTDEKWIPNRDIVKTGVDGKIINVTRPDENSWFRVTVIDKDENATVVQKEGYGREFDLGTSKSIVIRDGGTYQIQLEGGYVYADTYITVPRKGNIEP